MRGALPAGTRPRIHADASISSAVANALLGGKLDPGREHPLHVSAWVKPDMARASPLFGPVDPRTESLLWSGCVGFRIVANRALSWRLLRWPGAGPRAAVVFRRQPCGDETAIVACAGVSSPWYGLRLLGDDGDQHGSPSAFAVRVMARGSIFDLMIGVPSDCSGAFAGCERMPAALRAQGLADSLGVIDAGNLQVVVADPVRDRETGVIGLTDLLGLSEVVRDAVSMHQTAGRRPLLVGGDCTLLLGVWAALARARPDAGLLFVDGHLDCFDGQTSPTGEGADMELAALLGVGPPPLVGFAGRVPALCDERVVVLGPFDEDDAQGLGAPNPRRFAPRMPIVVSDELQQDPSGHTTRALARLTETADGFWLHLDLDVLSASALPAVDYADERGLSWEQLGELLARRSRFLAAHRRERCHPQPNARHRRRGRAAGGPAARGRAGSSPTELTRPAR